MVTIGVLEVIVVGVCGSWRWLTISCLVMCLLWIGCLFFVPETPVYYLTQKKYREAREALEWGSPMWSWTTTIDRSWLR